MPHSFIDGTSMSGKSTLAKSLAASYMTAGRGVLVLDPMNDPEWQCSRKFTDMASFLEIARQATGCALFVDEAGDTIGMHPPPEVKWLATQARHWGHKVYFISQRPVLVNPTIRGQCIELFLFNSWKEDGESWAKIMNEPLLGEAYKLPQYNFMHKRKFKPADIKTLSK